MGLRRYETNWLWWRKNRREIEGRIEGRLEEKNETAKKMLEEKFDINTIIKITGLTKEELDKLK